MQDKKSILLSEPRTEILIDNCECDARLADEEEKENMMAEIHLTYEEILQLE